MSVKKEKKTGSIKDGIKIICNFLNGRLENRHVLCFILYFSVISVLELAAYSGVSEIITILAAKIWLAGGAICLLCILFFFAKAVKTDLSQRNIVALAGMAVILVFLFRLCGNVNETDVSPDAAQQAAAGLNSFLVKDLNYTGKAFLGYPNRQYVLIAVPALLFGRSITTLQLGFAIPFVLGLLSMYSGLREWLYKKGISGNYAVIAVYAVFAFRYVTEYYINFEQAIIPISLTMILIGLILRLICRPDAIGIFSIGWVGCLCCNSYTTALAALGLLLVSLALLSIALTSAHRKLPFLIENRRQTAGILIAADLSMSIFFLATLLGVRLDKITKLRENVDYVSFVRKSIYEFLTDKNAVFLGFMGILVIIYLIAALTLRLKLHDFLLSLWVLGVLAATNLLEGYTTYDVAWVMQRALVVIPVLVTGMTLTFCDFVQKHKISIKSDIFIVVLIALAVIGRYNFMQINQSFTYYNYIQPMKYMLEDLETTTSEEGISHTDSFNYILYTDSVLLKNPADYFKFLYPQANIYLPAFGEFPEDIDLSKPTIIYGDKNITGMTPSDDIRTVPYADKRYEETGVWYKICILP